MHNLILILEKSLTAVAVWASHISLRGFVVIMGVILALFLPTNQGLEKFDIVALRWSSYLFSSPSSTSDIAIVTVPQEEITTWQSDIHASGKLAALLSNILNSSDSKVGILLNQPVNTGAGLADDLIERVIQEKSNKGYLKQGKALLDQKFILMDLLKNDRVVIGVKQFVFAGQKPLLVEKTASSFVSENLKSAFFDGFCSTCVEQDLSVFVARPKLEQKTVIQSRPPYKQAIFFTPQGDSYSGFLVQMLRVLEGVSNDSNLVWNRRRGLTIGEIELPLSSSGTFIPLHSLTDRMAPIINTISLNEALARSAFPDVLIIASDQNNDAINMATALYSVRNQAAIVTPWWAQLFLVCLFILVTGYLTLLVTRFSGWLMVSVSALITLSSLLTQIIFLTSKNIWLPLSLPLAWLVFGHFLVTVWRIKNRRVRSLVDRADNICISRAKQFIDGQELKSAFSQLEDCSVREPMLQTLYDISEAYTEKKDYRQAIDVLNSIQGKRKSFKDTEQKLQVLTTMLKSMDESSVSESLQKTVVISPEDPPAKILGRYELGHEIGRGAMGRVYLGFDPRIARRVAVKTLTYDSCSGKEMDEIKSRFFREAEAAGRLNHPSIVSVFDVGEEGDMAYIAMDFAEGKALNHFVSPANLLPVFEVYRIICDVATALEYAHENNIVHRDVKPGNIIYNPSPYQVKVTDFGIARLVDDSKTSTGEILGSPLYMAPEQLKGSKVNRSADIFSLGVTFYQLLTGCLPYGGDNLAALTYEIIHGKHKSVRSVRKDLPASAARITNQALQKNIEDRYETAAEMAMVLKKAIKRDFSSDAKKVGYI